MTWTVKDGNVYDDDGVLRVATYLPGETLSPDPEMAQIVCGLLNRADGATIQAILNTDAETQTFEAQETIEARPFVIEQSHDDHPPIMPSTTEDDHYVVGVVEATDGHPTLADLMNRGYLLIKVTHAENIPEPGTTVKVVAHGPV